MNGRTAKAIRRKVARSVEQQRSALLRSSWQSLMQQPLRQRISIAWHILIGR